MALSKEIEELAKRMKGMDQVVEGLAASALGLTYVLADAPDTLLQTFTDPKVTEAVATQFGTLFWTVFRRLGVEGIEKLRPAWEALLQNLATLGLDAVQMGLGTIGHMMDVLNDPRVKAILSVGAGQASLMTGALAAGYASQGMVDTGTTIARAQLSELEKQGLSASEIGNLMADQLVALNQMYAATGQQMPDDLKAAMAAAGITVLPTVLDVLKDIRDILKGGAAAGHRSPDTSLASGTYGLRLVRNDMLARIHQGEGLLVVPRHEMSTSLAFHSFAKGSDDDRVGPRRDRDVRIASPGSPEAGGPAGGTTPSATKLDQIIREIQTRPVQPVTQVFQPTFKLDPLQTKESRDELGRTLTDHFLRDLRNNPTVQYAIKRAAGTA